MLRPGNAGSNTAAGHIEAARLALAQLPRRLRRRALIRTDSGGGTHEFLAWLASPGRHLRYPVGMTITDDTAEAILDVPARAWTPAYDADGQARPGAWVAEITGLLDLSSWPEGMRVIVRKERPHPGAQLRFTDIDGHRFTCFATDAKRGQIADLELRHRRRARCEDRIRAAKDTGLRNLPLHGFTQNQIWCELAAMACELTAWVQMLALDDLAEVALGMQVRLCLHLIGRKRQPQADARAAGGAAAAFYSAAVPDGVPGNGGQAEPEPPRDLASETWARVLDREQSRVLLPGNLDRHGAGRPCGARRVAHQVRHHPAKEHRVNIGDDGLGPADQTDLTRPGHAFRGGHVAGDTHQIRSAGTRRVRRSKLQRVLDQLCQPLSLLDHLLQPGAGGLRQAGLGQRGTGQREHAGNWLAHVVAGFPPDLHRPGRYVYLNARHNYHLVSPGWAIQPPREAPAPSIVTARCV
jgi:hypothetical protein